uniref:DUF8039 domain-containing protein n=1 Tax=Setaria viridis TaxID=4556 RepID=A0A4U6TCF6_SETVI|nr:hypothetical protein SEVIR_8G064900v2 [Setaria viridis]
MLNPEDGSFVFGHELREVATRLVDLIKKTTNGSFMPNQERDELTMALGNPEHPRRCRGKGHIDSYRSCQRSKADHARLLRELQEQIAAAEARMEEVIDQRVALALSKQASEQAATSASGPHIDDNQCHPMDDITGRAPCELVTLVKNKLIVVAYDSSSRLRQSWVDRVVDGWNDLELEIPRGDREKNLGESIHGWILELNRYIRITQPNPSTLGSSPQGSRARSPTPSARAPYPLLDRDPSMSPIPERDPSMTPPPMSMATRRKTPSVPPTVATKKQKKQKEKQSAPKKPYDMTDEELRAITKASKKRKKSGSTIPQLGAQSNQSVAPLQVLFEFDKNLLQFAKDTNLTVAQLRGEDHIPKYPGAAKWKYEYGKLLASAEGFAVLEVRIGDQHFFCGEDNINVLLKELYCLFNQDALDKSLIGCWIQTCRRKGYYQVGFMDLDVVNESTLRDKPNRTLKNIYKFLDKQHYQKYILLLHNFKFHWILIVVVPDMSFVYVFDSLRKPKKEYNDIIDATNKAWARFY